MFVTLLFKECKNMLKEITYYIFLICLLLFYIVQMEQIEPLVKPEQGSLYYGSGYSQDETIIMNSTLDKLLKEYYSNSYGTYPIGFYKEVILSNQEQQQVTNLICEVTGLTIDVLNEHLKIYFDELTTALSGAGYQYKNVTASSNIPNIFIERSLSYTEFQHMMYQIDDILGGGSSYAKDNLKYNAYVSLSFEEATDNYNSIVNDDKVSRAYARLFCDYMGIVLGILPLFLAVTRCIRDKRSKATEVIYSKPISSFHIITSRYLAIVIMAIIPVLVISIMPTLQTIYNANTLSVDVDYFAFIKYTFIWLFPTVLVVTAIGFFITELTGGLIAILIQGAWWFISILIGASNFVGYVGWNLIPRFNNVGSYQIFQSVFKQLLYNRALYLILSVLLVFGTIVIYGAKRKGTFIYGRKIHSNIQNQLEV